ncbi:MAG: ABC transporter permease [Lachnospiraceae bacterium]
MSYAQVSAFVSPQRGMQQEELSAVRSSLVEKLSKDSYGETKGNARVWIDAYSGEASINIRKDSNTLTVTAVGVGGDFFQFHPIPLLAGGYISDEDLNNDRIVVDENFAWAMFGSNDIAGMQVWIDNTVYVIAGVVKVEEDSLYKTAYGNGNRIYMSYDQLKRHQENLKITCYEAVLPNPISNYAYYALRTAFGMEEESEESLSQEENPLCFDDVEIIENSNRYETIPLFTKVKQWKFRSMRTNSVGYPYWENIARVAEDEQIIFLVFRILVLIFPCLCLIWWLYDVWRKRTWTVKSLFLQLLDKIREKQEEKAEQERLEAEEAAEEEEDGLKESEEFDLEEEEPTESDLELRSVTGEDLFQ